MSSIAGEDLLYSRASREARQRHAYYGILHEDARFVADLENLRNEMARLEEDELAGGRQELLYAFARKWPGVTPRDLSNCLQLAAAGEPLRLQADSGIYSRRPIRPVAIPLNPDGGTEVIIDQPYIFPLLPIPFLYNPFMEGPGWVRRQAKEIARAVHDSIVAQAEHYERLAAEQDWKPTPSRQRDWELVQRMARRLYRAVVCRWSNDRILAAEANECADDPRYRHPTPQAVSKSVIEWADTLGIRLPKR